MLTELQLQRNVKAGKASYASAIRRSILSHTVDGIIDWDAASRHLSALRRLHMRGIRGKRGVTNEYMRAKAEQLGLC